MKACVAVVLCAGILTACSNSGNNDAGKAEAPAKPAAATPAAPEKALASGIDKANMDTAARAPDDFYRYVNGHWLDATEITADKPAYGVFTKLFDDAQAALRAIIEDAAKADPSKLDVDQRKVGDFYASFLDQ